MFYVTVRDSAGRKAVFAAGPFCRHGDAQRMVGPVKAIVAECFPSEAPWCGYGTSRVKGGTLPAGKFNAKLGLTERVTELDPTVPQGWWVTGDTADPVAYVMRHGTAADQARLQRHLPTRRTQ